MLIFFFVLSVCVCWLYENVLHFNVFDGRPITSAHILIHYEYLRMWFPVGSSKEVWWGLGDALKVDTDNTEFIILLSLQTSTIYQSQEW